MSRLLGGMRGFIPIPESGPHRPIELPSGAHFWAHETSPRQGHCIYVDAGPELDEVLWDEVVKPRGVWKTRKGMRFSSEPAGAIHVMTAMAGWRMIHVYDRNGYGVHRAFFGINDWLTPRQLERYPRAGEFQLAVALAALLTLRVFGEPLSRWHLDNIDLPGPTRSDLLLMAPFWPGSDRVPRTWAP